MLRNRRQSLLFVLPALLFMAGTFGLPLAGVIGQSFANSDTGAASLAGYTRLFASVLFYKVAWTTILISISATAVSLLLAYPAAYYLAGKPPRTRALLIVLVLVPFWTSILVKSFAFTVLLGQGGVINQYLGALGLPTMKLLFNRIGVIIGMTHYLTPFMIFPILSSLLKQPPELKRAAQLMGAGRLRIFLQVTVPLSLPGVMAGVLMVLVLSLGFFVVPALLGGKDDMMLASLIEYHVRETLNLQMAACLSVLLILFAIAAAAGLSLVPGGSSVMGGAEE